MANWGPAEQDQMSYDLGWTKSDSQRTIWGLSHTHLANAIELFSKDSGEGTHESPVREAIAAWTGFAWLAELGERPELTQPLAAACDEFVKGLTEKDEERTIRGYSAVETVVNRIRAAVRSRSRPIMEQAGNRRGVRSADRCFVLAGQPAQA